jgi:protein TonB
LDGARIGAWAHRLLNSRANSLEYGEASLPHTLSPETVSRRRPTQTAPRRRPSAAPVRLPVPGQGALSPDFSWPLDGANRSFAVAIAVSVLVHAILLKIHFVDPRGKMSDMFQPTLEVVLVNARTTAAPKKAEVLAQANLDGGGNSDAARRAKTPLPPQMREQPVAEVALSTRKLEQKEEQVSRRLSAQTSKDTIAQEPEWKAEPQRPREALLRPDAADLLTRSLEAARLQAEIDRNLEAYSKRPRRNFVGSRAREFRFARYVEDWRTKVERVGNMNYPTQARQQKIYGSLQLTVSIKADGTVESIDINKPSGQAILDDAARRIVALAAPYAPFPPDIAKDTDILSITRTWTFTHADELVSQ